MMDNSVTFIEPSSSSSLRLAPLAEEETFQSSSTSVFEDDDDSSTIIITDNNDNKIIAPRHHHVEDEIYFINPSTDINNLQPAIIGNSSSNIIIQRYSERSFHFFTQQNRYRRIAINLVESKWLGHASLTVIFINCIALGFLDSCDFNCIARRCQILQFVDLGIFGFFFAEMMLKMFAMGIIGKRSYLSHPWNVFDFLIVVVGSTEFVYGRGGAIGLSSVRTFRVLRPLRAINRIPSLKILVELLLESLPMLGNVLMFAFFIFFVFGVIGIQLWAGILRNRCFFPTDSPEFTAWLSETNMTDFFEEMPTHYRRPNGGDYVCTSQFGMLRCEDIKFYEEDGSICDQLFHDEESEYCRTLVLNYTECRPLGGNPSRETVSFDNIGAAWIAIFQVINLESWTEVMYFVQDAYSFYSWIYFFILIVIGTFFALNLCLVVIASHFQEAKRRTSSKTSGVNAVNGSSVYVQVLDLIIFCLTKCGSFAMNIITCRKKPQKCAKMDSPNGYKNAQEGNDKREHIDLFLAVGSYNISLAAASAHPVNGSTPTETGAGEKGGNHSSAKQIRKPTYIGTLFEKVQISRAVLRVIFEHNAVSMLIMGVIFLNTLVMATEHDQQPESLTIAIENINIAFTCFFAIELCLKIYAYGLTAYIRDGFNMLDLIVVLVNLFELIQGTSAGFFVLRAFRLVRLVKIVRFLPGLQRQVLIMLRTIDNVASFFLLVSLFLFIFAIMGMSLFGCQYCPALNKYMVLVSTSSEDNDDYQNNNLTAAMIKSTNSTEDHNHDLTLVQYFICPRTNFDTLPSSLFTVLQVFTQDSWTAVLKDGMTVTSPWAALYFVGLVSIGNYVLLNLLVAILVEGFSSSDLDSSLQDSNELATISHNHNNQHNRIGRHHSKTAAPLASLESLSDSALSVTHGPKQQHPATHRRRIAWVSSMRAVVVIWKAALKRFLERRSDYAFFLIAPDNFIRKHLIKLVTSRYFDNVILCFIFFNCIVITMERPSILKGSIERRLLDLANSTINVIFFTEAVFKIIAKGLIMSKTAYLRDNWNILDFLLVSFSTTYTVVDTFFSKVEAEAKLIEVLRVLRILRALRPLRVVNRAPGLKIVVETLLLSVRPIGSIIVITSAFFLIFAILGVQMFRGCFYKCVVAGSKFVSRRHKTHHGAHVASEAEMTTFETLLAVKNSTDCHRLGATFEWENESYNFDNVPQALMSLFVFATFDGWVEITRAGIDCVGFDQQPVHNYNPWRILYFLSFLLIVCFFVVNMFVGVVVTNFEKVHKRVLAEKEASRKRAKMVAIPAKKQSTGERILRTFFPVRRNSSSNRGSLRAQLTSPPQQTNLALATRQRRLGISVTQPQAASIRQVIRRRALLHKYLRCRLQMYRLFTHKYFELVLVGITTFNVLIMAVEYYQMPRELFLAIKAISYTFTLLLLIELGMKLIAMGTKRCLRDRWTQLDIFILSASIIDIVFEDSYGRYMPINPTIFRLLRLVRIARVFRLLKTATGVRRLLDTVSKALPKVAHLSVVFLLLFFIYATLGVELFGKFSCPYAKCGGLSRHASFEHFGIALLTLFRVFTGDKWNSILKDMLHVASDHAYCHKLMNDSKYGNVGFECRTAGYTAPFYFVSFVLTSRFVLINVVIAVLMSQMQQSQQEEQDDSNLDRQTLKHKFCAVKAPPNSLQNSRDDLMNEISKFYQTCNQLLENDLATLSTQRPSTISAGAGDDSSNKNNVKPSVSFYSYQQQPSSLFSLSASVSFGNDTSFHLIDESSLASSSFRTISTSSRVTSIRRKQHHNRRNNNPASNNKVTTVVKSVSVQQ